MKNKIKKINWYRLGGKKGSYLSRSISFSYMILAGYLEHIPYFGFKIRYHKYIDWVHYVDKEEKEIIFSVLLKKLLKTGSSKSLYFFAKNKELEVEKFCDCLSKTITSSTSNKQIARMFKYWVALKAWPDVIVLSGNYLVRTLSQEVERQAKKYFFNLPEQQLKEQLIILSYNSKKTVLYSREREILELAIKLKQYRDTSFNKLPLAAWRRIDSFNKKYAWMTIMFLIATPLSNQKLWREIKTWQCLNPAKRLKELIVARQKLLQARNKLQKTLKPNQDFLRVLNLLRESSWVEAEIIKFTQMSSYYSVSFLNLIAKRLRLTYNNLIYLGYKEIIKALKTGILPHKSIVAERKLSFGFYANTEENVIKFLNTEEARLFKEKQISGDQKLIKGMTASPGKARGKVRIILDIGQILDFKSKEILVTTMTIPSYVIAMKKAAAIVTNDGGITCHAAIVSRELGVPCIIGTKIAIKVLKDGDYVGVDVDKGVVKILKKK